MSALLSTATKKIPRSGKRRICFPITSRAYYGRSQLLIKKLHAHPEIELELMLGGSILLDKYSRHIADDIEAGGFSISGSFLNVIEGGNHVAMAKTACLTALEFTNGLHTLAPDVVVICGDRFEQLAIAMAAAYLNLTLAHIEGGDVTGSIDESVRHAITKLSHFHFVTNEDARRRVLAMGEDPRHVYNTGSLDVELAARVETVLTSDQLNAYGVGHSVDLTQPFLLVVQHPVTTERDNRAHIQTTLEAVARADMPTVWFWPNADAGTAEMAETLRHVREQHGETDRAHALHHQRAGRGIHLAPVAGGVSDRQLVGGDQGVLVSRHAGGQHRRPPARASRRAARDSRRLRRRRDPARDCDANHARPLSLVVHLPSRRHERSDPERAHDRGAVYAKAVF